MKKLKSEKGAITIVVLVSVLFFVSFLISSYVIIANKVQTQKEIIAETKKIYEPKSSMEDIYNSYFNNDEVIPIYTVEQLLSIGEEEKQINIDGKYYTFTNTSSYILKNDLEFNAVDLGLATDWVPLGSNNSTFEGNFEGNGHTIEVTNLDGTKDIYTEDNLYGELCTLTINTIQEDAIVTLTVNEEVSNENIINVPYNTVVNYTITKEGYTENSGTIEVTENTTLEVDLEESGEQIQ